MRKRSAIFAAATLGLLNLLPLFLSQAAPELPPPKQQRQQSTPTQEVRVIGMPERDWYDRWVLGATLALAIVGVVGVSVALITLRKLERQTKGTEDAAKAALNQIELMKAKERARIAIELAPLDTLEFGIKHNRVMLKFSNIGSTHAFNVYAEGDARAIVFENVELMKGVLKNIPKGLANKPAFEPLSLELEDLVVPSVLKAGESYGDTWVAFIFREDWQDALLLRPRIAIEVRGEIRYEDVFGDEHFTRFSYDMGISKWGDVSPEGSAPIHPYSPFSQWRQSGGEDGNRAT